MVLTQVLIALAVFAFVSGRGLEAIDSLQSSSQPRVDKGSPGFTSTSLTVSWDTTADKRAPRIQGYELQYAVAAHGAVDGDNAVWRAVEGDGKNTWDITVHVDGFDRSIGKSHTVKDGWFTLVLSRTYPKPSPLPDLWLVTEPIAWDDTWADMETKVKKTLRESNHPQYSSWTAAVVRCDETEERGNDHWAGGCPFLEYGGYTWHLRLSPPAGGDAPSAVEDFPVVTVLKETITAKWTGQGDQVTSTRYGGEEFLADRNGEDSETLLGSPPNLVDPFFCQRGTCVRSLKGLAKATPYLVRLRAYNRNGFGPWEASTTDMSLRSADGAPGISTDASPPSPTLKPPRLSSFTSNSLTVLVETTADDAVAGSAPISSRTVIEAYELEIQPHVKGVGEATSQWVPVIQSATGTENQENRELGLSPLMTAAGLSPSTGYRFRVVKRHADGMRTVSGVSEVFTTGPGLPRRSPSAPTVDTASIMSSSLSVMWSSWAERGDEDPKKGGAYVFEAQWEQLGSDFWQEATTLAVDSDHQEWRATAKGLKPYSHHRFRVRAVNDVGAGEWSTASDWVRTEGEFSPTFDHDNFGSDVASVPESVLLSVGGEGHIPAHSEDFDYYHGVGTGGQVGSDGRGGDGGAGAAVIISRAPGTQLPERTAFFFTGSPQLYAVPNHSDLRSVTLKLWGAGGGGVLTAAASSDFFGDNGTNNATRVLGGGGGFLQVEIKVSPGEMLQVLVGGGGGSSSGEVGGPGGFNGGQTGGSGMGGGAGGGGSTSVLRRQGHRVVAAAGGGGGAGNADVCCAGGGAGGGEKGEDGDSPMFDQAIEGRAGDCHSGWCTAVEVKAASFEGFENWFNTGGSGGNSTQGGQHGNSDTYDRVDGGGGKQGAVSSPRSGETSIPVVFKATGSRTATPGRSLSGGVGANGARSGGGGGGGFYGGGGGGSGKQGGGGGGGSSFAEIDELFVDEDPANERGKEGSAVKTLQIGESWVEVEWDSVVDAVPGEEPVFYEVEISEGNASEDFYLSARVDALDQDHPVVASSFPRPPGAAPPVVLKAVLLGLSPNSEFNVRVAPVSRFGPGRPSPALSFSTKALPENEWEQVIPLPSTPERRGRGLWGPGLGTTEAWNTDLTATQTGGGFSNPPTELRQTLPSPRSGHTIVVIAGKVYMFGGISDSSRCSSAIIGSTALGDTPGGATTDDCLGGEHFSNELWEYNPALKIWTEVLVSGVSTPAARDGHTASVAGSKMVIFGGRGNGSRSDDLHTRTALLDDEWEIDLDLKQDVTSSTNSSTAIREGAVTFIPIILERTEAQQLESDVEMCVEDMSVTVDIEHSCTGQLELTLYGPGPPPGDTSHLENTPRAEPVVLFVGYNGSDGLLEGVDEFGGESGVRTGGGCGDGMAVIFKDSASRGVWECCGRGSPFEGTFKAVERLLVGQFLHMPAEGEWTLGVLDTDVDGSSGNVTSWSIRVEVRPCDWRSALRWRNVTSSEDRSSPPRRSHHTAAVVDGGLFISGGTGSLGELSDLWRRGNASTGPSSKGWTLLAEGPGVKLTSKGPMQPHGASIVLSPWGVLSSGGMRQGSGVGNTTELWVLDPVSNLWLPVTVEDSNRAMSSWPEGRYRSGTAIIHEPQKIHTNGGSDAVGRLVMFGGKDDWRRLNDLWQLQLRFVNVTTSLQTQEEKTTEGTAAPPSSRPQSMGSWSTAEAGRDQRCAHVFVEGMANDTWHASCGEGADAGGGDGSCTMGAVLTMAWCLGEYQGVGSAH